MTVHLCHFIRAYVNEQKVMVQIGTIIPIMVSTNTFQSSKEVINAIGEN